MFVRAAAALVAAFVLSLCAVNSTAVAAEAEAVHTRPWHLQPTETWQPADPSELQFVEMPRAHQAHFAPRGQSVQPTKAAVVRYEDRAFQLGGAEVLWANPLPVHFGQAAVAAGPEEEAHCLAIGLYHEARGESELGQIAVAQVILNRVKSRKYPDSICGVVFENEHRSNACQFSFACDGRSDKPEDWASYQAMKKLADDMLCAGSCNHQAGRKPPQERLPAAMRRASLYHTTAVRPGWSSRIRRVGRIGAHIFYISDRVMSSL
jgi:N-acetylmuramoyl-L-alanine amidase